MLRVKSESEDGQIRDGPRVSLSMANFRVRDVLLPLRHATS